MLGLEAFFYACLHFAVYLGVDQFFDWSAIGKDIVKRKFITVGFAAFVLLIPLAITSTDGMVRRLGFARWKRLHRLVYVAAVLGVVHFVWRVKSDLRQPLIFAGVLAAAAGHSFAAVGSRDASGTAVDVTTSRVRAARDPGRRLPKKFISYSALQSRLRGAAR